MAKYTISPLNFNTLTYFTCQLSFFPITQLNFYFGPISVLFNHYPARPLHACWHGTIIWQIEPPKVPYRAFHLSTPFSTGASLPLALFPDLRLKSDAKLIIFEGIFTGLYHIQHHFTINKWIDSSNNSIWQNPQIKVFQLTVSLITISSLGHFIK